MGVRLATHRRYGDILFYSAVPVSRDFQMKHKLFIARHQQPNGEWLQAECLCDLWSVDSHGWDESSTLAISGAFAEHLEREQVKA